MNKVANTYIQTWLDHSAAEEPLLIELGKIFKIDDIDITVGCDYYDWSLEITFEEPYDIDTFVITLEQVQQILDLGCHQFWINFYTGLRESKKKVGDICCGKFENKIHISKHLEKDKIITQY